jgi:hypothetical protein
MPTFFTTAKPFPGHDGIIQRNALKSWTRLHPEVEVILFGDEGGAAKRPSNSKSGTSLRLNATSSEQSGWTPCFPARRQSPA